jgi:hypothetical protein
MYKLYQVEGGYEIYWCPFAPIHFNDRVPYDGKVYSTKQAGYRRCKQLNEALQEKATTQQNKEKGSRSLAS